jgi:hypothetical protein
MKSFLLMSLAMALVPAMKAADSTKLCAELAQTEKNFCDQAATLGIGDAFLANMADECFVPDHLSLTRSEYKDQIMAARAKAGSAYKPGPNPNVHLVWTPSKVEVSADGTLGYTWGRYDFTSRGKDGKTDASSGVYLTIWKRQDDGSWKFVYDGSPELPEDPASLAKFLARPDMPHPPQ